MNDEDIAKDVARVNAVAAALSGPMKVWMLSWSSNDSAGAGASLYSTKEKALAVFPDLAAGDWGYDSDTHFYAEADEHERAGMAHALADLASAEHADTGAYEYALEEKTVR